jgi:hypothetical protein
MKKIMLIGAMSAMCATSIAFAQGTSDAAPQGLQAGDNVQGQTQPGQPSHKGTHHKMHKTHGMGKDTSPSGGTAPGGTATPGTTGAPVSASGSGQ